MIPALVCAGLVVWSAVVWSRPPALPHFSFVPDTVPAASESFDPSKFRRWSMSKTYSVAVDSADLLETIRGELAGRGFREWTDGRSPRTYFSKKQFFGTSRVIVYPDSSAQLTRPGEWLMPEDNPGHSILTVDGEQYTIYYAFLRLSDGRYKIGFGR
jgi:hypothetical protein